MSETDVGRRRFLKYASLAAVGAIVVGGGAYYLMSSSPKESAPTRTIGGGSNLPQYGTSEYKAMIDAAVKEGSIRAVLYVGFQPVAEAFQKKYGIKVETIYGGAPDIVRRVSEESQAGVRNIDVFGVDNGPVGQALAQWTAPYNSPEFPRLMETVKKSLASGWNMFPSTMLVPGYVYNKDLVKKEDLPKSMYDLLDPKWKGKLLSRTPWLGSNISFAIAAFLGYFNQDWNKEKDFLSKLYAQVGRYESEWANLHTSVGAGEFPIGIISLSYTFKQWGTQFPTLRYGTFKEGILWWWNGVAIHKNAPHPNASKLFADYNLSDEAASILASNGYVLPRQGFKLDPLVDEVLQGINYIDSDFGSNYAQENVKNIDLWTGRLQQFSKAG